MSAATLLADHVDTICDVFEALPYRPATLSNRIAFVAPADTWKQFDEEGLSCELSVGLDVYLVSGAADYVDSFEWLDEQSTLLMQAGAVDVDTDTIATTEAGAPFIFADSSGASYLACRVTYSRFRIGE